MYAQTSISLQAFDPENSRIVFDVTHWDTEGSCAPTMTVECEFEVCDYWLGDDDKNELSELLHDYDNMYVYLSFPDDHPLSDAEMRGCFEMFKKVLLVSHMTIHAEPSPA